MKQIERDLLAGLLGSHDALFEPHADHANGFHWQRMAAFCGQYDGWPMPPGALPWDSSEAENAADKKRLRRALKALEKAGHVTTPGRKVVAFTDAGLRAARELCGLPQLESVLCGLDYVLTLDGTEHERDEGHITEASLFGFEPIPPGEVGRPRLPDWCMDAVSYLTPLLGAGMLDVNAASSRCEMPLYALTAKGREMAERRRDDGSADPNRWLQLIREKLPEPPEAYATAWDRSVRYYVTAPPLQPSRIRHPIYVGAKHAATETISAPQKGVVEEKVHDARN